MMRLKYIYFIVSILIFATIGCNRENSSEYSQYQQVDGMVWNTTYHVTFNGDPSLKDSIASILTEVGNALNVFDPESLVSKVNKQDSTPVNDHFIRVFSMSVKVNRATDGAFDPTIAPLIRAWGFAKGHTPTTDTLRIDSILDFCGIQKTHIASDMLVKDDIRTEFNFSAIAKGYGCDMVGRMLEKNGVENYLVEIGGEISAKGKSPSDKEWRISIDKPEWQGDTIIHNSQLIVSLTNCGMATSGNYRNFHVDSEGKRYGHTISTKTGRPVVSDIVSATVIANSAMEADAWATSFMALGADPSIALNKKLNLPIFLILADSTTYASPKFKRLITSK